MFPPPKPEAGVSSQTGGIVQPFRAPGEDLAACFGEAYPIANVARVRDWSDMRFADILEATSAKAPFIIGATIFIAVAGAWSNAPQWPFYSLGVVLMLLAAVLWVRRGAARQLKSTEQLGFTRIRDWLWFESSTKGLPHGYSALGFLSLLAVILTGLRFPYVILAFAAMALTVAWGEDKRRYPAEMLDEE